MKTTTVTVTPELAKEWLKRNFDNRAIKPTKVEQYALAMMGGDWKLTHQGIAFDETGALLDGQHRLLAVIEAETPVEFVVFTDAPRNSFDALDIGAKRSMADIMRMPRKRVEIATYLSVIHNKMNEANPSMVGRALEVFAPELDAFEANVSSKNKRYISIAPVRAAVVLRAADNKTKNYALENYNSMVRLELENCTPAVRSLFKQLNELHNVRGRNISAFARAYMAFDPKRAEVGKIQVTNLDNIMDEARKLIDRRLSGRRSARV